MPLEEKPFFVYDIYLFLQETREFLADRDDYPSSEEARG